MLITSSFFYDEAGWYMNKILVVDDELILNLVGIILKEACKEHAIEIMNKKLWLEEYTNIKYSQNTK